MPEEQWPQFFKWSEAGHTGATDWPEAARGRSAPRRDGDVPIGGGARSGGPTPVRASPNSALPSSTGDRLTRRRLGMFLVQLAAWPETRLPRNTMGRADWWVSPASRANGPRCGCGHSARAPTGAGHPGGGEMLGWTTPVVSFMRTTTRPTELAASSWERASRCSMLYASPNRGSERRSSAPPPTTSNAARDPNPHVAFGDSGPTSASGGGPGPTGGSHPSRGVAGPGSTRSSWPAPVVRTAVAGSSPVCDRPDGIRLAALRCFASSSLGFA